MRLLAAHVGTEEAFEKARAADCRGGVQDSGHAAVVLHAGCEWTVAG